MKRALIIGLNNYPGAPLNGCINDANNIYDALEKNSDDSPNFDCKLITDDKRNVTKGFLRTEIETLFDCSCDTALLYFSGHGCINSTGGYIVTPDYSKGDEGISMDIILNLANSSKATNKIIILDCCHSGALGSPKISGGNIAQIADGVTILTASRDNEYSMECNGSGVFTSLLLEGLSGSACDLMGNITLANIYSYIDSALGAWDQRPIFKTNVSRFAPIKKVNPLIDICILRKICNYFPKASYEFKLDPSFEYTSKNPDTKNVTIFKELQKLQSVGLVQPCDAQYMYFAAMESKSCKLTTLGYRYWRLAHDKKI
ncbi:TPA: caspase domain-containing protein [Clostridium perfringens]